MAQDLYKNLFRNQKECLNITTTLSGHPLPAYVKGSLYYNGPVGIYDWEHMSAKHWFDGMSIMSLFKINGKSVTYTKSFLKSEAYNRAMANGRIIMTEYGTPGSTDKDKSLIPQEMTDNCANSIYRYGNLTIATTETCLRRSIDPDTLDTLDTFDLSGIVHIASGRPLQDHNGDYYNLCGSFVNGIKYHFLHYPNPLVSTQLIPETFPATVARNLAEIPSRLSMGAAYYHTFGMSENYLIMVETPWISNNDKLITSKKKGISFKDCLEWHPKEKNLFHVVEKKTGNVLPNKYLSKDAFFFLNFVNCYEKDDKLIVDMIVYDTPDVLEQMYLDRLRKNKFDVKDPSKLVRYVLPLNGGCSALEQHIISNETGMEHPKVSPKFAFREYTYSYVIGWLNSVNRGYYANAVTKVNMNTGKTVAWRGDEFSHPAEIVMIPNPATCTEDDGVIIASVTDVRDDHKDYLVFIDARNMTEIARANFDEPIPFHGHSVFLPK